MDIPAHSISAMKSMEVIDINTGTKLGLIKDLKIDIEECKIISIILPGVKVGGWFSKEKYIEIEWSDIQKIGVDVILVNGDNLFENKD
ncbi:YlmC/YmxH family sporulation protein [Clostridium felsineum]|uniref:Sporulation protein YlmC n=1 Tax=Clostridium felsineum TaxID=36839 RepID=A0A1S8MDY1_9CLOT|nr:YlmC/YmxH family sporulation protein [Clostridium felsineum]MCR3759280.1 YlmC/YmxH family sporulation protein [Clostridium felsineum]URZ00837.1 putative sporulation protein YlmC [Clostridium felsineum]URZ06523.1 putative sporulation protein YlmC [Clostridium felsineum]URZ11558.1 putative sporulation protein YlmC [Clostridium felsineum]URZ16122.1 putative sporulation protein YlmC [Clostridium felsineum DSM 794]